MLNRGATDPDVLTAVLSRFVQYVADDLPGTVEELRRSGRSILGENVQARLVAFGVADDVEDRDGYRAGRCELGVGVRATGFVPSSH